MKLHFLLCVLLSAVLPLGLQADADLDRKIEAAALASYNFRSVLKNEVQVRSVNGVVRLQGTVLDREQRALAEETVQNLPGVVAVENELDVSTPGPERADGWIALKIRSVLIMRKNVSVRNTDVSVEDGIVALTGTAGSEEQKRLTEAIAREIEGVKTVRNELRVAPAAGALASGSEPPAEPVDDGSIVAQIARSLRTSPAIGLLPPRVDARHGVVTLRGRAASVAERDAAVRIAQEVRGVTGVINEITVEAAE